MHHPLFHFLELCDFSFYHLLSEIWYSVPWCGFPCLHQFRFFWDSWICWLIVETFWLLFLHVFFSFFFLGCPWHVFSQCHIVTKFTEPCSFCCLSFLSFGVGCVHCRIWALTFSFWSFQSAVNGIQGIFHLHELNKCSLYVSFFLFPWWCPSFLPSFHTLQHSYCLTLRSFPANLILFILKNL
jgi:hypothetical protein